MITCRRFVSIITEEHEGALPPDEQARFDEHRTLCPPCRHYLDGFDRTVELLHELPPEPAPEAMRADILARLRARKGGG
jgi:anti-sigma factor RsiW